MDNIVIDITDKLVLDLGKHELGSTKYRSDDWILLIHPKWNSTGIESLLHGYDHTYEIFRTSSLTIAYRLLNLLIDGNTIKDASRLMRELYNISIQLHDERDIDTIAREVTIYMERYIV